MKRSARIALVSVCAAAVVGAVGGTVAVAATGGSSGPIAPDANHPIRHNVEGKMVDDYSIPHGTNDLPPKAVPSPSTVPQLPREPSSILTGAELKKDGVQPPFGGSTMAATTAYYTVRYNDSFIVYAGSLPDDPSVGVIFVGDQPADALSTTRYSPGGLLDVKGTGAFTITSVGENSAALVDSHGKTYTLDFRTATLH